MTSRSSIRHFARASVVLSAALIAAPTWAAFVTTTYVGRDLGLWSVASNWSGGVAPNNGAGGDTYHVVVDNSAAGKTVTLNMTATIDRLTVDAGDGVSFQNDIDLTVGHPINNDGVISLNSTGGFTDLLIASPMTGIAGGGTLLMGNHPNNRITGAFFDIDLINGVGHTIRGAGQIGANVIDLINEGIIDADQPATPLVLDLRNGLDANFNAFVMQASGGGTLHILNSAINNTAGLIRAQTGSFVDLNGANLLAGDYNTVGSGLVRFTGNSTLTNPNNLGKMVVLNDVDPTFAGAVTNAGLITLESTGGHTDLQIGSNPTTFTGGGAIEMGNHFNNRISGAFFDIDLVNAVSHTIRGAGQIGVNVIDVVNHGLIEADQPTTPLQLDLRNGLADNLNNGIMQAAGGATLILLNSNLDNSLGLIRAQDGSFVDLNGANVLGGELVTFDSGLIRVTGNSTLSNLTNSGHISVLNDVDPSFSGTITNQNLITLESTGGHTDLRINSNPTTFTGPGQVVMGTHSNNRITGDFFDIDLVNAAGHTIRGAGQIGINVIDMINNGLVQADQPETPMQLDLRNGTADNFNNGVMEAVDGATLTFVNSNLDNSLGTIRAGDASFVDLTGTTIVGGVLTTLGSGLVRLTGNSTLSNLTNSGHVSVLNDVDPSFSGTITNQNLITLESTGGHTDLRINSDPTTFAGPGQVVMGNDFNNRISGDFFDIDLVNAAGHTIRGAGQIGINVIDIVNQGSIIADAAAGMSIDQRNNFDNQGLLAVVDDGAMTIQFGPFTTSGAVQIDAGRTLTRVGDYNQTAGTTTVHGTLAIDSGSCQLTGGMLRGSGQVTGTLSNSGGVVSPGASPGILHVQGNYNQMSGGNMLIELNGLAPGTGHDQLTVSGTASLAGRLIISKLPGFNPAVTTQFTILTAGSVTGQFEQIVPCTSYQLSYTPTSVILTIVPATAPADLNCDGHVNGLDIAVLLGQWTGAGMYVPCPPHQQADLNQDCRVNGLDLAILLGAWTG